MGYTFKVKLGGGVMKSEEQSNALDQFSDSAKDSAKDKFQQSSQFQQIQTAVTQGVQMTAQVALQTTIAVASTTASLGIVGTALMVSLVVVQQAIAPDAPAAVVEAVTEAITEIFDPPPPPVVIETPAPPAPPAPDAPAPAIPTIPFNPFALPDLFLPPAPPSDPTIHIASTPLTGSSTVSLLDAYIRQNICQ